jgi:hypothetical protein
MPDSEDYIDIILTRPPGPDSDFVEIEDSAGRSFRAGTWRKEPDGTWALRIRFRGSIIKPPRDAAEDENDDTKPGFV